METAQTISGKIKPFNGWTNKFIFPPYTFSVANCMITNFHLPKSPMMMEVAAFAGYDVLMKAYKEAIAQKYIALLVLGFILMLGGGSNDPDVFNEKMFDFQHITLSTILILAGFVVEIIAIFWRGKK